MTPEHVLQRAPLVLDRRARERDVEDGFLTVPGHVSPPWLDRLRAVVAAKIEESRGLTASDDQFDLAPDHCAEKPNIRRLRKAVDQHPLLWTFAQEPAVVDLVADLLGRDIVPTDVWPDPFSNVRLPSCAPLALALSASRGEGIGTPSPSERERAGVRVAPCSRMPPRRLR